MGGKLFLLTKGSICVVPEVKCCFGLAWIKCQVPTRTALSLPLLNWTGERKYDGRLESRDKDKGEITHRLPSRTKLAEPGEKREYNSSPIKSEDNEKINPDLKTPFPHPSRLPGLSFNPVSLPSPALSSAGGWGMGVLLSSSHVVSAAPSSSGEDSSYSSPLQHEGPSHGGQFSTNFSDASPSPGEEGAAETTCDELTATPIPCLPASLKGRR